MNSGRNYFESKDDLKKCQEYHYHYSWGDEDLLGARIEVVKSINEEDVYDILFEQNACETKYFDAIGSSYHIIYKIIEDTTELAMEDEETKEKLYMPKRIIKLKVKAIGKPDPSSLFTIITTRFS